MFFQVIFLGATFYDTTVGKSEMNLMNLWKASRRRKETCFTLGKRKKKNEITILVLSSFMMKLLFRKIYHVRE
jgi:hypothetical protein